MLRLLVFWSIILVDKAHGTIDVNLSELEYLAVRLNAYECRRLIAALHYTSYELPKNVAEAERRVDDQIPCLQQLLHWNSSPTEGRGKTHEAIVHRLRQIGRNDLADWLGKTAFKQLGKDLERSMDQPFKDLGVESSSDTSLGTVEPPDVAAVDEDLWSEVNTILLAIVLGLLGTLITLICITLVYRIKEHFRTRNDKYPEQFLMHGECFCGTTHFHCRNRKKADPVESEGRPLIVLKKKKKRCDTQCHEQPGHFKGGNQTDTDVD